MEIHKLIDSFHRNHPTIEGRTLELLLAADPTFRRTVRGSYTGRYGVWIGNMYANGSIKPGDIPELKSALLTYDKNKTHLPQIKDCKSLSELIAWVKDLSDDFKPVRKQSKAKADLEKVYEDDAWVVYVPHSHAAARRGGEGTHWCTASEEPCYFNRYSKYGPLYINIRKSDGAKFQFHFETNQFMDADDEPLSSKDIGLSEGIVAFYNNINPLFEYLLKYDRVEDFVDNFAAVRLNGEWNFIDANGQLLSEQWFDFVQDFRGGVAAVKLNGKWNFINTDGQLLSQRWFDWVENFNEGLAAVRLNGKWNFINTEGRLLSKWWVDWIGSFNKGFACVELNGKYNFINTEGQLLSNKWFDGTWGFNEGVAKVYLSGKYNFINTEGKLLSTQWFDGVACFKEGFAAVELNRKWNFINTKGQFLSQQWFDDVDDFNAGLAQVKLNGEWNYINTEGQILRHQWFDWGGGF